MAKQISWPLAKNTLTDKPLVIIVDGGSQSASEILAGVLQDNKRALLIGTKTNSNGLVQSVSSLEDGSGLAVTVAKLFTPSGRDIDEEGINPDIEVRLTKQQQQALSQDQSKIGTASDPQYIRALAVLNEKIAR